MTSALDFSSLQAALSELNSMYAYACSEDVGRSPQLSAYMRTACIKGFEYAYELSYKFMRRFLDIHAPERAEPEELGFRALVRESWVYGLIPAVEPWLLYREKRNITSHTYDHAKAVDVFVVIPSFLRDAQDMLDAMRRKQQEAS